MKALRCLATAAACGFLISSASADILYFDAYGLVTVNGQPAAGVTVEVVPCTGATLPADWPAAFSTVTTADGGTNYSLGFASGNGNGTVQGPPGSFTFQSPANGAWYTAVDAELHVTSPGCTPVIVSCADVRAAFVASLSTPDHLGVPHINVDVTCVQEPPPPPPPTLLPGDTASIGFWKNKNGQALIKSLNGGSSSTALGNWLASNFPSLFGANAGSRNLTGKSNLTVASLFAKLFGTKSTRSDAQLMATALSVYVTDSDLAGNAGARYDFNISTDGTGAKLYNVGLLGSAIGIANNSTVSVMDLLLLADAQKQAGTYNAAAFGALFEGINESGEETDLLLVP